MSEYAQTFSYWWDKRSEWFGEAVKERQTKAKSYSIISCIQKAGEGEPEISSDLLKSNQSRRPPLRASVIL